MHLSHTFGLLLALALTACESLRAPRPLAFDHVHILCPECCAFRENRTAGVCRPLPDCPQATHELYSAPPLQPTSCGFDGSTPIVCCLPTQRPSERACNSFKTYLPDHTGPNDRRSFAPTDETGSFGVVGGTRAVAAEFPHMAALGWTPTDGSAIVWRCGGTLISDRFVLTAAHCVRRSAAPDTVRIGAHDLSGAQIQDYGIADIVVHPEYGAARAYNDIALIRIDTPVWLSDRVLPACLWHEASDPQAPLLATGFGLTEFGGHPSVDLLKVQLTIVPTPACAIQYGKVRQLPHGFVDSQLCAGDATGARDTCEGDSGGPLGLLAERQHRVVGITSFGRGCATLTPGVYTRVSAFVEWIERHVWP